MLLVSALAAAAAAADNDDDDHGVQQTPVLLHDTLGGYGQGCRALQGGRKHGCDRPWGVAAAVGVDLGHRAVNDPLRVFGDSTGCSQGGVMGAGRGPMGGVPGGRRRMGYCGEEGQDPRKVNGHGPPLQMHGGSRGGCAQNGPCAAGAVGDAVLLGHAYSQSCMSTHEYRLVIVSKHMHLVPHCCWVHRSARMALFTL